MDKKTIAMVLVGLALAACSPEASRTVGGGSGADPGNRILGPEVNIHGETNPAYRTPQMGQAVRVTDRAPGRPGGSSSGIELTRSMGGGIYPSPAQLTQRQSAQAETAGAQATPAAGR